MINKDSISLTKAHFIYSNILYNSFRQTFFSNNAFYNLLNKLILKCLIFRNIFFKKLDPKKCILISDKTQLKFIFILFPLLLKKRYSV